MTAKKIIARKGPAAKSARAKTSARKIVKSAPAKAAKARGPASKSKPAAPAKRATKSKTPAARKPAAKPLAAAAKRPPAQKTQPPAKAAAPKKRAAASRSKPAASTGFDPNRRRELIAAAAARRRKTVTVKAPPVPIAIIQPREPSPVERHRFSVGDDVRVISTSGMWFKHGVDYRVTAALPPQAGKLQYRIKNEQEPFERVVSESQLASPAARNQSYAPA